MRDTARGRKNGAGLLAASWPVGKRGRLLGRLGHGNRERGEVAEMSDADIDLLGKRYRDGDAEAFREPTSLHGAVPQATAAMGSARLLGALPSLIAAGKTAVALILAVLSVLCFRMVSDDRADTGAGLLRVALAADEPVSALDSETRKAIGPGVRTGPQPLASGREIGGLTTRGWPGDGKTLIVRLYTVPIFDGTFETVATQLLRNGFVLAGEDIPAHELIAVVAQGQTDEAVEDFLGDAIQVWRHKDEASEPLRLRGSPSPNPNHVIVTDALGIPLNGAAVSVSVASSDIDNPFEIWLDWRNTDHLGRLRVPRVFGDGSLSGTKIQHPDYGTALIDHIFGDSIATGLVRQGSAAWERALAGMVNDDGGRPVAGAEVLIHHVRTPGDGLIQSKEVAVVTDAQGRFAAYLPVGKSPHLPVEDGALIPPHSRYKYTVRAPQSTSLVSVHGEGYNDVEVVITLAAGSFHTFAFEDGNGRITEAERLQYVTVRAADRKTAIDRRFWQEGAMLTPGTYQADMFVVDKSTGSGERVRFAPVEVTPDSPSELVFQLPSEGPVFVGQVVSGVTGHPLPGIFVMARNGHKSAHVADFTAVDWATLDSFPANAPTDCPALEPLRRVYMFGALDRTDAAGRYRIALQPGGETHSILACGPDWMPVSRYVAKSVPNSDGMVEMSPIPLFPAATVAMLIVAEDEQVQYIPWWKSDVANPPDWAQPLVGSHPQRDQSLDFENGWRSVNKVQQRYVPAGLAIHINIQPSQRQLHSFNIPGTIKLGQGQYMDLGTFSLEPAIPVDVQVLDMAGMPVEGVPIRKNMANCWSVPQNTDTDGWARFFLSPTDTGQFAVLARDDEARAREEDYDPVVASVEFNMNEDMRENPSFALTLPADDSSRALPR
jgi:hypothetical protein